MHVRRFLRRSLLAGVITVLVAATPAEGQLRPLHPLNWQLFDEGHMVSARIGGGLLVDQRASLAGGGWLRMTSTR